MRKIYWSLGMIAFLGAMVVGGTGAFFGDVERSSGNTFAAGAIDLKIDNESYYNGNICKEDVGAKAWLWEGTADYPVPGTACSTSFPLTDLDDGLLFFNFNDLKPDDEGEDTISIHVQNDAWACMDLTLTSDDDISSNEPELGTGDPAEDLGNAWDGELAETLEFFWWADDGDNVYEDDERDLSGGVKSLLELAPQNDAFSIVLADSEWNAWGEPEGTPLPGGETVYIAKAWCMGDLTTEALEQDGSGELRSPNDEDGPGVVCDGTLLGNQTQTDGVELTLAFRAEQARNNEDFLCNPPEEEFGTLTVNKALLVSTSGIEVNDFTLHIVGPNGDQVVTDEVPVPNLPTGSYTVYEQITGSVSGKTFTTSFSGVCSNSINVGTSSSFTLNANDNVTCTILNDEIGDFIPPTFN